MAPSQKPIDVFVCRLLLRLLLLLLLLSLLWFCLAIQINGWSCRAWDIRAYRMGSHTHTHTHTAVTKRPAKQK